HTSFSRDWSSDVCSSDLLASLSNGSLGGHLSQCHPGKHAGYDEFIEHLTNSGVGKTRIPQIYTPFLCPGQDLQLVRRDRAEGVRSEERREGEECAAQEWR